MIKNSPIIQKKLVILVLIIIFGIFSIGFSLANNAYAIKVDGETIGFIEDKELIDQILLDIKKEMEDDLQSEVIIIQKITVEKTSNVPKDDISSEDDIRNKIEELVEVNIEAFAINADDKDLTYLDSEQDAAEVLNQLKERFTVNDKDIELKEISFVEKVKIEKTPTTVDTIKNKNEAFEYIVLGSDKAKTYVVKNGDTVWDIAIKHNLTTDEIGEANPDVDLENIKIGEKLIVISPQPLINVKMIEEITYEESIPYPIQYEKSNDMYIGDSKIKVKGSEGKKKIHAELIKINGIQEEKNIIKEIVLKEPKTRIIIKGTKERPKTMASGKFLYPARGRLTSSFGSRWGRQHGAIDVAMSTGTIIKASDGGKVTYSGRKGAYGNLVIIDHENGYETRYAHNSTLLVKKGQRVYKGQAIAKSGNTGRSTGPHMHFEVRKNGVAVNPLKYIR